MLGGLKGRLRTTTRAITNYRSEFISSALQNFKNELRALLSHGNNHYLWIKSLSNLKVLILLYSENSRVGFFLPFLVHVLRLCLTLITNCVYKHLLDKTEHRNFESDSVMIYLCNIYQWIHIQIAVYTWYIILLV